MKIHQKVSHLESFRMLPLSAEAEYAGRKSVRGIRRPFTPQ